MLLTLEIVPFLILLHNSIPSKVTLEMPFQIASFLLMYHTQRGFFRRLVWSGMAVRQQAQGASADMMHVKQETSRILKDGLDFGI